ncbi:hypothetical protein OIU79_000415 [Salix purpurea]|uniref:Uncharacterized protein n=1 Tax=Salix purpurea TaxID=77065 RepID=A0A9Q0ZMW4_SALPP|nr:hypothetical protein OIU79_000415 [Salix purpurea]
MTFGQKVIQTHYFFGPKDAIVGIEQFRDNIFTILAMFVLLRS